MANPTPPTPSTDADVKTAVAASKARQAEANDEETATVEWRGLTITFSRSWRGWSYDMIQGLTKGNVVQTIDGILEDQDDQTQVAFRRRKPRGSDMEELYGEIQKVLGLASGD